MGVRYERPLRPDELMHYGVKGMKWGIRRYQNYDGTWKGAGKDRHSKQQYKSEKKEIKNLKKYSKIPSNDKFAKKEDVVKEFSNNRVVQNAVDDYMKRNPQTKKRLRDYRKQKEAYDKVKQEYDKVYDDFVSSERKKGNDFPEEAYHQMAYKKDSIPYKNEQKLRSEALKLNKSDVLYDIGRDVAANIVEKHKLNDVMVYMDDHGDAIGEYVGYIISDAVYDSLEKRK